MILWFTKFPKFQSWPLIFWHCSIIKICFLNKKNHQYLPLEKFYINIEEKKNFRVICFHPFEILENGWIFDKKLRSELSLNGFCGLSDAWTFYFDISITVYRNLDNFTPKELSFFLQLLLIVLITFIVQFSYKVLLLFSLMCFGNYFCLFVNLFEFLKKKQGLILLTFVLNKPLVFPQ